jgi:hypothetical protein
VTGASVVVFVSSADWEQSSGGGGKVSLGCLYVHTTFFARPRFPVRPHLSGQPRPLLNYLRRFSDATIQRVGSCSLFL